jgi:hypothetical protein
MNLRYPATFYDPARLASGMAGVTNDNDQANGLIIRNYSPNGVNWRLWGAEIINPNHTANAGTFSDRVTGNAGGVNMISMQLLDNTAFYTGLPPISYGNAGSGTLDMSLRPGNTENREYTIQAGLIGIDLAAEGPLGKSGSGSSYLVNYRYSTLGVFQQIGIDFGTGAATPLYQDINYKFVIPAGKKTKFSLFGIAGNSSVKFLGKETDTTKIDLYGGRYSNTIVDYATNTTGLSYDQILGEKTTMRIVLGYSYTNENFRGDSISAFDFKEFKSGEAKFTTNKYSATLSINHKFNAKNNLVVGVLSDYTVFNLLNKDINQGIYETTYIDLEEDAILSQAYAQWKHRFGNKLQMVTGVHSQWLEFNNTFSVEPRAALRWSINTKNNLSLGYGLHSQIQPLYTYHVQTPKADGTINYTNTNLDFTKSHHSILTYDRSIGENMHIKTEAYYQYIFDVPIEQRISSYSMLNSGADFAPNNTDSLFNNGTGQNYGVDLTIERYFAKGYYFLITGSIFNSSYKGSDKVERNTAFNTQNLLNVLGGKEFKLGKKGSVLALNLKVSWIGGRYLTPIDLASSELYGSAIYKEEQAFSEKQKDYFRCDVKIAYRKEFRKSTMEIAVDLQNVTNNQNVFNQSYNPVAKKVVTNYQQGFFPVPFFRFTF